MRKPLRDWPVCRPFHLILSVNVPILERDPVQRPDVQHMRERGGPRELHVLPAARRHARLPVRVPVQRLPDREAVHAHLPRHPAGGRHKLWKLVPGRLLHVLRRLELASVCEQLRLFYSAIKFTILFEHERAHTVRAGLLILLVLSERESVQRSELVLIELQLTIIYI